MDYGKNGNGFIPVRGRISIFNINPNQLWDSQSPVQDRRIRLTTNIHQGRK
jgi:hypothetical protein